MFLDFVSSAYDLSRIVLWFVLCKNVPFQSDVAPDEVEDPPTRAARVLRDLMRGLSRGENALRDFMRDLGGLSRGENASRDFMRELRGLSRRENALRDFMRELRGLSRRERDVWLWFWMSCCNRLT